jgi:hypothetical protein
MGGVNCDGGPWGDEEAADQPGSWSVERAALWAWIAETLERSAATTWMPVPWRRCAVTSLLLVQLCRRYQIDQRTRPGGLHRTLTVP